MLSICTMFGWAATQVAIKKRNLDVQTKMSEPVFLDPVGPDKQTVFIQVKNTSDKEIEIAPELSDAIAKRGFRVIQDPNLAHFMLQVNILSVGKTDPSALQSVIGAGYGGSVRSNHIVKIHMMSLSVSGGGGGRTDCKPRAKNYISGRKRVLLERR